MYNEPIENDRGGNHLKKKYLACLAALLLLFALAVPAFAEPEVQTAPADEVVTGSDLTAELPIETEEGEEPPEEATFAIMPYSVPETTTVGAVAIDDVLLAPEEDEGLLSQRNLTYGALGLAGLALLLSVVALARTRKKTAPNATGNYQKYF